MTATERDLLVGRWFLAVDVQDDGCRIITWQGDVLGMVNDAAALVQTYSWVSGEPYEQMIVRVEDMTAWRFYDTPDEMHTAYDRYCSADVWGAHQRHEEAAS